MIEQVVTCTACDLGGPGVPPTIIDRPVTVVAGAPDGTEAGLEELEPFLAHAGIGPVSWVHAVACPTIQVTPNHIEACVGNLHAQLEATRAGHDQPFVLLVGLPALKAVRPDLDLVYGRGRPFRSENRNDPTVFYAIFDPRRPHHTDDLIDGLDTFARLVAADNWVDFIPDTCSACNDRWVWIDDPAGLGWCEQHLPAAGRAHFERLAALKAG